MAATLADVDGDALTAFAVMAAAITERQRCVNPTPDNQALATARLAWARHRLPTG
jgi:hypothetical protein